MMSSCSSGGRKWCFINIIHYYYKTSSSSSTFPLLLSPIVSLLPVVDSPGALAWNAPLSFMNWCPLENICEFLDKQIPESCCCAPSCKSYFTWLCERPSASRTVVLKVSSQFAPINPHCALVSAGSISCHYCHWTSVFPSADPWQVYR